MGLPVKALHGGSRSFGDQMAYHLKDGRAIDFEANQPGRIDIARFLLEKILVQEQARPLRIIELGCGAGDISGPYSGSAIYRQPRGGIDCDGIEVIGVDVVPAAQVACNTRWPGMTFMLQPVEEIEPIDCDILVMCEFLEHVEKPLDIIDRWMTRARWAIIGHPLDEPDPPFEPGHCWSYTEDDWVGWFQRAGFQPWEKFVFPMGTYERMVIGHGSRR